ncbi:DNA ligase D [Proteiniclasticum sp.]|uniref:DNA ligase D n=1 Tax=Proteiniclasticum sp. TaxID=2053595 RepID=UPI0028973E73|nr:DNA ligase D [Proteiniclasticum sp.]
MAKKLEDYNRKRNFSKTSEPQGKEEHTENRLRFVVQKHAASRLHFDFRIEWDGVLLSWAVPKGPSDNPKDKRLAVAVEDHPLEYRNFEGNIPEGEYGGGTVMLFDEGFWESQEDMEKGLKEGSVKMILYGERLVGKWALVRMKPKEGEEDKNWLLIKEKDEHINEKDTLVQFGTSIRTGRTMDEIREDKENDSEPDSVSDTALPFTKAPVQLAKLEKEVPAGDDWVFELKYDGYRIISYIENGKVRLMTRNGQDYTGKFSEIAKKLEQLGENMVLDGEIVIFDENGKTDFQKLQNYLDGKNGHTLTYVVFDLLAYKGEDYREHKLIERKEKLHEIIVDQDKRLHYSSHTSGNGKDILLAACNAGMEGIICKKADSLYHGSRNGDWVKVKCEMRQEFVIGGYTLTSKKRSGVSALLLGYYEGEELIYAGRAGTGFTQKIMKDLAQKFEPVIRKTSPFENPPDARKDEEIFWMSPKLIAEIRFQEWTDEKLLRQASFKGLRKDKNPKDVVLEEPQMIKNVDEAEDKLEEIRPEKETGDKESVTEADKEKKNRKSIMIDKIRLTSPDKDMYDGLGVTKEDVAKYYIMVAERMLPYTQDRILSFLRCPEGTEGECFYQKHADKIGKGMKKIEVREKSGDKEDYIYISDIQGIISAVQMGILEFHAWGSRVEDMEKPDMMVFDLDPAEGMDISKVREGVRDMKTILDELSLTSFLKTSGGKGYHVVVPLNASVDWETVRAFAKLCAQAMEERWPDKYTSNMRKEKRKGKIFIDWVRNGRSATSVTAYSLRARKDAPVSMPISWEELDKVLPAGITIKDAEARMKAEDPWKDFYESRQGLKGSP